RTNSTINFHAIWRILHYKNVVFRSEVRLPEGPLRVVGEHEIEIHLHTDVTIPVTLNIVADE
ncbi:MAG: 50S ribosomal L9 C-terminal domain-containing protein, partial [Pseudomonadota bacterium]